MLKRIMDSTLAALGLVILSLPLLVLSVLVLKKLGSPILFRQTRPGLKGKPFAMIKFRTMTDERDAQGQLLPDEQRLTPFGRWLRSTSADELPELLNVLLGHMSIVGPRPLLMRYLPRYNARQFRRHEMRPGITGWAQVNGRNAVNWTDRFEMDVWYVENQSFLLDCKIIALTFQKVLKRDGISAAGEATMGEFLGNGPEA